MRACYLHCYISMIEFPESDCSISPRRGTNGWMPNDPPAEGGVGVAAIGAGDSNGLAVLAGSGKVVAW